MAAVKKPPVLTDPASVLLSRLERVHQSGKGWRADCPCGHGSRGTLSVMVGDDNRLLLHCFAACGVQQILDALGMELADLFHQREQADVSPAKLAQRRDLVDRGQWRAALGVLATEATVLEAAGSMIERGEVIAAADLDRVRLAALRIHAAREVLQ